MKRRLFNLLAGLSLLLCVATVAMWVRSHWVGDQWTFQKDKTTSGKSFLFAAQVRSTRGAVEVVIESGIAGRSSPDLFESRHSDGPADPLIFQSFDRTLLERLGFRFSREPSSFVLGVMSSGGTSTVVNFPIWFLTLLLSILPLFHLLIQLVWKRRLPDGFCGRCGYDLRATPDRCPECGTIPTMRIERPA